MNRIVWNDYPHEKLPDDVRNAVDPSRAVTLVIEQPDDASTAGGLTPLKGRLPGRDVTSPQAAPRKSLDELLAELSEPSARGKDDGVTMDEAVARIRALRDEWDD